MKNALRIGVIYLVLSVLWIYFSDLALSRLVVDPEDMRRLQTWKGWAFVLASSVLIVYLVHRELVRVRESGDRFRALVEQSLAGVYLIRDGRFLYVNPKLADVFGYEPGAMVRDVAVTDVVAEEDRELVRGNLALREEGRVDELQYRFTGLRSDGERIRVEVHGRRVTWDGSPAIVGVLLDVTEREQLEARAREAQKLEVLGMLTGQIAHDFNNLLTAILGPLEVCVEELPEESGLRPEVEEALGSARRAASLSRKLLAFSRNRPTIPRAVALNAVLEEMAPLMARLVGPGVRVRLDLDPGPCTIRIDPSDLEQVIMNLVLNAGEAIQDQGTATIRTGRLPGPGSDAGRDPAGQVWLEVEDDGMGMDEDTRRRVLEPFFTTKLEGTGLGLSTVFGLVAQADGSVDLRSREGEGTCFRVVLPATDETPEPARIGSTKAGEAPALRPLGTGETVLLVEDEEAVRRAVARALERFGYRVLEAANAETAFRLASAPEDRVDLILTDVQLPDGMGPEVADRISELHPGVAVLYASGYSDQEITDRIADTPGVRLLEKPFSIDALLRAVRDALDRPGEDGSSRVV